MTHEVWRSSPRVFFSDDDAVIAYLETDGPSKKEFPATVMNMSEGGLGMAALPRSCGMLQTGDLLYLKSVKVKDPASTIRGIRTKGGPTVTGIKTKVRWVLEDSNSDRLTMGVEFLGIDVQIQGVIRQFLNGFSG